MANCPRDGPATSFWGDPEVTSIFNKENDHFGLVLVAGWPPNAEQMAIPYQSFIEQVRSCFDPEDVTGERPRVHLYDPKYLHVTIATLYPVEKKREGVDYEQLEKDYTQLVQSAVQRPDWPAAAKSSSGLLCQLQVESTQLGQRAGILLWKDISGNIDKMRYCLQQQAIEQDLKIHAIPGIIHSTFLRFSQNLQDPSIQDRFQSSVIPNVQKIFHQIVDVDSCKLVCERTPYMHIPDDDHHVLWRFSTTKTI